MRQKFWHVEAYIYPFCNLLLLIWTGAKQQAAKVLCNSWLTGTMKQVWFMCCSIIWKWRWQYCSVEERYRVDDWFKDIASVLPAYQRVRPDQTPLTELTAVEYLSDLTTFSSCRRFMSTDGTKETNYAYEGNEFSVCIDAMDGEKQKAVQRLLHAWLWYTYHYVWLTGRATERQPWTQNTLATLDNWWRFSTDQL